LGGVAVEEGAVEFAGVVVRETASGGFAEATVLVAPTEPAVATAARVIGEAIPLATPALRAAAAAMRMSASSMKM